MIPLQELPFPQFDPEFQALELLNLAVAVFALILLVLSLIAYQKTGMRRMLLVSIAFALFAVKVLIQNADLLMFALGFRADQIISSGLDFAILFLFFLAIVVRS